MRRSSSALSLLSLSKLVTTNFSTLILFLLLASFLLPSNAFAQGSKRKSLYDPIEEKDKDRPDKRAEWNMRGREAPKGQSAAALRLRAHQQKMAMRAAREATAAKAPYSQAPHIAASGWVALGPAPLVSDQNFYGMVSGRSTAIAIDPSDATGNTVYAAGASGGVWKSTNAANAVVANVTWTPVTDQQASLANGAVSVKPDGSVVLVGTGEPNNAGDSYYGVGILRSTNGGSTWTLIPSSDSGAHPFAGLGVSKFAWAPGSNTVVAATATTPSGFDEGLIGNSTNRGLYLSTDSGQTWAYQALADGSAPISASDVVYNATAGKFFASVRFHGVYSSTNGTNWTRLTNQPNPTALTLANCPTAFVTSCPMYRGQLAVVPGRNEMYFWFADTSDTDWGIWQSTDGGTTWKQIDEAGLTTCGDSFGCGTTQAFYDLEISAVADGTATDIYTGAVNLFKCKLASGATTCSTVDANLPNSWLNLTHVYGCSTIANVHPDEHGLDFLVAGGKDIMYFGNDGGVYRALDGYTGLNIGSCSTAGTNQFDNLNASSVPGGTIGSMTQFVSFSVHPTDQNTLLGGTQDNGSPATGTATSSSEFFTAFGGDGGFNAINQTNGSEWFISLPDGGPSGPGFRIGVCESGTSCANDVGFGLVADSSTLGGDHGAFYTPYILDPQSPDGDMYIGTCRVWRLTSSLVPLQLSNDFDDGLNDQCLGQNFNVNLVRGLAAGGSKDANGFSKVVYAATEGTGPAVGSANQFGGEVWATTAAGTTSMSDVTRTINPSNYTISSVEIDNSDTTGNTAYVGIMGFNTSHVWKTTTAGGSWADWTGTGLPDSPVNALLVDSQSRQIYAGTDVGVFVSSASSASWTEVGPAPSSGGAYLPNVPVSAIRMFNSGGVKKVRASTYGRGIWESVTAPGFNMGSIVNVTISAPGQSGTAQLTLTPYNGFTGQVSIVCTLPASMLEATCPTATGNITDANPVTVTVAINTTGPHQVAAIRPAGTGLFAFGVLAGVFVFAIPGLRRSKMPLALLLFGVAALIVSCGGGGGGGGHTDPGTPTGTYTVNLNATSGGVSVPASFSVTVQ
jgi:hypothetical protein